MCLAYEVRQESMKTFIIQIVFLIIITQTTTVLCSCNVEKPPEMTFSYNMDEIIFNSSLDECGCNSLNVCIRKCCAENYTLQNKSCVLNYKRFSVAVYKDKDNDLPPGSASQFSLITGIMQCAGKYGFYRLDPDDSHDKFYFQENGELWLKSNNQFIHNDQFCLEDFDDVGYSALVCFPKGAKLGRGLNIIGMLVSMPFLLSTFIVYALLPDKNLHGKALMCYVISLFGAYVILVSANLHSRDISDSTCKAFGVFCLFFFMVSFFWMNVMSIDIWWTFSGLRGFNGSKKETERKRFFLYSGYAFGVPFFQVILVLILSTAGSPDSWYYPGIGDGQCWFYEGVPTLLYFYIPMAILITVNVVLFAKTAWKIKQIQDETSILRRDDNRRNYHEREKQRFNIYLKFFLAMGINWSLEIISWVVNWQVGYVPPAVWYLTDLCNALYGVFIFFLFVLKKNVLNLLQKRYYMIRGKLHLARTMTATSPTPRTTETELSGQ